MPELSLPDGALFYDVAGTGAPALVFIHGYSCSAVDWRMQVPDLAAEATCITLDLRGHGRSTPATSDLTMSSLAADVLALMDGLHIEEAVLVGHSMGTRIALEAALQAPDRVSGLALVDGSKVEAEPGAVRRQISAAIEAVGFDGWSEQNMGDMFLEKLADEDQQRIVERAIALGPKLGLQLYVAMTTWDQSRLGLAADRVKGPISVIQATSVLPGEARVRFSVSEAPNSPWLSIWRERANAEIIAVRDAGHFVMLEQPDHVNQAIRRLIKQI